MIEKDAKLWLCAAHEMAEEFVNVMRPNIRRRQALIEAFMGGAIWALQGRTVLAPLRKANKA